MMRRRKVQFLIIAGLLFAGCVSALLYVAPRWNQSFVSPPVDHRAVWEAHGISKYQIHVVAIALPAPVVEAVLTIEYDEIVEHRILACEQPPLPEEEGYGMWLMNCETIRDYYRYVAARTISDLFDLADSVVEATQASLQVCNAATGNNFSILSSEDEMMHVGDVCKDTFEAFDGISVVNYDPEYGYPTLIASYSPNALDGYGRVTVEDFQILD